MFSNAQRHLDAMSNIKSNDIVEVSADYFTIDPYSTARFYIKNPPKQYKFLWWKWETSSSSLVGQFAMVEQVAKIN